MRNSAALQFASAPPSIRAMEDLETELARHFGHAAFRPGQREVVETLLADRRALAIFPTGGGKSLCYQLPALLLPGMTIVVSPLVALMRDQVEALRGRGIAAARLDSTLGEEETADVEAGLKSGVWKLLYLSPERFAAEDFRHQLRGVPVDLLAIDEAHCISEWGHNFRPDYLRLAPMVRKLRIPRVLALTATATAPVAADIRKAFGIRRADHVQTPFHRPNLDLWITPATPAERMEWLADRLKTQAGASIVYVTLQHTAESVAGQLQRQGLRARAYHAGLGDDVRREAQEDFMSGRCDVMVATLAFGMGIDKSDIRAVYHYNLPKTLENYQQETGRAGRDGGCARCEMFVCPEDLTVLRNFILGDTPDEAALRALTDHLLRQGADFDISRYEVSRSMDVRPLVLETVITHLEAAKLLEPAGTFHSTFKIAFEHAEERILAGHSKPRQKRLRAIFESGKRWSRWLTIRLADAAERAGVSIETVRLALLELEEAGDIVIRPSGLRHRFRLLPATAERRPAEVAAWLHGIFSERERRDLERIADVVKFANDAKCSTRHLLRYFGEKPREDCGHCGHCVSTVRPAKRRRLKEREITLEELEAIRALERESHSALRSRRALARFLCGLSSPAVLRDRLTRHDAFGLLEDVPFEKILLQIGG